MSYGTEAGVAALAMHFTNAGVFDTTSNPKYATVTSWLAQISGMFNIALANAGFVTPITDSDIAPAIDGFVNALASDLAKEANQSGRFYSDKALSSGISPMVAVQNDVLKWVEMNTAGLVKLGAARTTSDAGQIGFRDGDDNGDAVNPLFTRDNFIPWSINS